MNLVDYVNDSISRLDEELQNVGLADSLEHLLEHRAERRGQSDEGSGRET